MFFNDCNAKQMFVGNDNSLGVVDFNDILGVPSVSCNLLLVYQITHSFEGETVEFSPHQVVIKELKDPKHILASGIVDDILPSCIDLTNLGHHLFPKFLLLVVMTWENFVMSGLVM